MAPITTGRYLKKDDCTEEGDIRTILKVEEENIAPEDKADDFRWVMHFVGIKPLILNTTNINRCVQAFGTNESEEWAGKQILVYSDPDIEFGGKVVGGVRLRAVKAKKTKPGRHVVPEIVGVDDSEPPF